MQLSKAYQTLTKSKRRSRVLARLHQPLTAMQLARRTGLSFDSCRDAVRELAASGMIRCLNRDALRSRLYWLTQLGERCQRQLTCEDTKTPEHFLPEIDWALYGSVCYKHRAVIVKTLTEAMQPAAIKRKARIRDHDLRMSANNVRDIIRVFKARGVVQPVRIRRKAHLRYELTSAGKIFQQLLWRAEVPA